ncbi:hypothetical protein Vadar_028563 [Vaccinium darrowii]|uniref:Uncharacterized protein n=1 Tax=Vaccinium darrowii TaxID=229202 RepID=A0ACB7YAS2_9ERIC|nr:hypothetical protein Vadar_028563 [Vaccinium darrowii]
MQTAAVVFGGEGYMDGIDAPPLMVANAGKSSHHAISSLNCPPFIAVELCREHLIESDADILWKPDTREKDEELATRGMKFLNWLWTRPEKEIAVVTHSGFLIHTLSAFGNECPPSIKSEIYKSYVYFASQVLLLDRNLWTIYLIQYYKTGPEPAGLAGFDAKTAYFRKPDYFEKNTSKLWLNR